MPLPSSRRNRFAADAAWPACGLAACSSDRLEVPDRSVEELDAYYGPSYAEGIYR